MFTTFFSRLRRTETRLAKSPFYGPLQHLTNASTGKQISNQSHKLVTVLTGTHNEEALAHTAEKFPVLSGLAQVLGWQWA